MGRFLSPDWNSDPDTVPYADFTNPQTLNLYSYGGNNPLTNTDADGHDYYLQGGGQCGQNGIQCDQQGYLLGADGNRQVVTDQALANGTYGASAGANGGVNITTGQGTFAGQFFDASPGAVSATVSADPSISGFSQSFIAQTNAYNQAAMPLLNTMAINSAASLGIMGAAEAAMGSELTVTNITSPVRVTFGHGARHLLGSGLQRAAVEQAIKAQVQETAAGASSTGSFWGKVVVNGQQIFYRAYTLANGAINVGTYTVGAP